MMPPRPNPPRRIAMYIVVTALLEQACGDSTAPPALDGTPPIVVLSLTSTSVSMPGDLVMVATASDEEGVTRVEFYERSAGAETDLTKIGEVTSEPYTAERQFLSAADNGTYEFTAKAYDAAGNVGTSNVGTATVNLEVGPPAFALSASHDRITTPGRITFAAGAVEGLTRLEIYQAGQKVGESSGSHVVVVDVSAQENGSHTYIGTAYNDAGQIGSSNPVTVSVDIRWDLMRELEGMSTDNLLYLASDAEGAAYVATTIRTEVNAVIDLNVVLSRYDQKGNRSWTRSFGGTDWESVYAVGVDPSGRVYISGYVSYGETRNADCFLAVYDASGTLLWTRLVDTPHIELVCAAATGPSGAFYLAGGVQDGNTTASRTDVLVASYDREGTKLWIREFGSLPGFYGDDIPTSIAVDPSGGVYVSGYTSGSVDGAPNRGGRDVFVVKFDGAGNKLWSRQLGTEHHDFVNSLAADPDGGVYVAGGEDHPELRFGQFGDALLARYSFAGALMWVRLLDGGHFDDAWDVAADQNVIQLVGRTSRGTTGELTEGTQGPSDAFLAQLSRSGELLSARLLGGPSHDGASGVALGPPGDVYVSLSSGGGLPGLPNPGRVLARHRPEQKQGVVPITLTSE